MDKLPMPQELKEGGVLLVDKPKEWTSFDVVNKLRRQLHVKIGHCGTLDPLATGLLILCTGRFTKKITEYQKQAKEYTGIIHLGAVTPTYDLESTPEQQKDFSSITDEQILAATQKFIGDIQQLPPAHSAIKKGGKRAYEYARAGEQIKLEPRQIQITAFDITAIKLPEVHFRVACSTGTYIRSLAHDLGQELGCGAYLQELRRTKIGEYSVDNGLNPAQWIEHWQTDSDS